MFKFDLVWFILRRDILQKRCELLLQLTECIKPNGEAPELYIS